MKYDVVIVGAGPGGLQCGRTLAENGVRTLIIERGQQIGKKVCAGGITRRGLIKTIPDTILERTFTRQIITTRYQQATLDTQVPVLATVNRTVLGSYMADLAQNAGADIISGAYAETIDNNRICYRVGKSSQNVDFDFLVGADGSNSRVRKHLDLRVSRMKRGIGIQYHIENPAIDDMVWNFDASQFSSGYSWIFPHRERASVGAYSGLTGQSARQLKNGLDHWLCTYGIDAAGSRIEAEQINWDYRGWHFGSVFLVGDAAGLASPLTGEGINPAIISGETAAHTIIDPKYVPDQLTRIVKRHRSHERMVKTASQSRFVSTLLSELCALLLRCRMISFERFEMA